MLLLAGLMGVLAIGATALVWFETGPRSDKDQEAETSSSDDEEPAEADGADLIAAAVGLAEAAPTMTQVTNIHHMDDPFQGGGWLEDDDDDFELDDLDTPAGFGGRFNDTPVVFDAVTTGTHDEGRSDTSHHALMHAHQENVTDFLPDQDRLVVVFDDKADPDPQLGLERDAINGTQSHVTLNGIRIATVDVAEGLTMDHITLIPESSLQGSTEVPPASAAA